ncbi:hypothetical protein GCK72_021687 [Caenorhabditis remanei]|uniref:DUF7154 domain-containing protein n=1 Tax=Caenorhabditis remanei TaxID=31234 RepID=A0A6A5GIU5_CAERE|nr:hypothetical protein GCK72_021687 [Caenorhabditis remanei]KAF1755118.1 hypothetical protein GCK72_021687 [Caenorhabditis remanei]
MYRLASETNGLCIFTDDNKIQLTPTWLPPIWSSYLVYSFNAKVKNSGYSTLPVFNSPLVGYYLIIMTLQDHGPLDTFWMVNLRWYNAGSSKSGFFEETVESHTDFGNSTYTTTGHSLDAVLYDMTLQYQFLGTINNDSVSGSSAPRIIEEPIYDEIYDTTPPSEFEQVDNQRHFGILRYIVSNRFRTLMLIALVSLVVVLFIFVFFLVAHLDNKHALTTRTETTPHSQSFPTTTNPFDRTDCSPNQKSTFFFAYSNDLTADQVLNTWNTIPDDVKRAYETFVLGRFDLNEDAYIDDLVSILKKYHAYVTFVVSNNSFGESSPEPLYRLASETNGVCIFTEDDNIQEGNSTYTTGWHNLDAVPYDMSLQYQLLGTINNDSASVSSAPGIIEEPTYVEINDINPPSEFGPVEKQRHFGLLRYIVTNRFRKLMLIALVNLVVVFTALFLFIFFLIVPLEKTHEDMHISSTVHINLDTTITSTPTTSTPTTLTTRTATTAYSHTSATTTRHFDPIDCTPNQKSTFFYAYSNDLTADQVLNTWKSISVNSNFFFETYALGRFDVMNNLNEVILTFVSNNSFRLFFFKKGVTHCGATLFIITKRLPTDAYIDDLVSILKKYHAHVTFVVSENSLGGLSPKPMYRLASETNGLCIFTDDDWIQKVWIISPVPKYKFLHKTPTWLPSVWPSYLAYSFNTEVAYLGFTTLPVFNSPLVGYYYFCMTLQDHGILNWFRIVFEFYNNDSSISGSSTETIENHAARYVK